MNIRDEIFEAFTKELREKGVSDDAIWRLLSVLKVNEVSVDEVIAMIKEVSQNAYKD